MGHMGETSDSVLAFFQPKVRVVEGENREKVKKIYFLGDKDSGYCGD